MDTVRLDELSELFNCKFCQKCYENPVMLPCGDKICKSDLLQMYSRKQLNNDVNDDLPKLKCPHCEESLIVPKNGFPVDKDMKKLIEIGLNKLDFGQIFSKANESVKSLNKTIAKLERLNSNPQTFINNYYDELKAKIDEKRNFLKSEIDKNYEQIIAEISTYENECLKLVPIGQNQLDTSIEKEIEIAKIYSDNFISSLSSLVVDEEEWEEIAIKSKFLRSKLNLELSNLEEKCLLNKVYSFKPNESELFKHNDILGSLRIKKIVRNNGNSNKWHISFRSI
jgi:hypothetical protein